MGSCSLEFSALGAGGVRFWLYHVTGGPRYNWITQAFDGKNEQSAIYYAGHDDTVIVDFGGVALEDGSYALHVVPANITYEPKYCLRVLFRIQTDGYLRRCIKIGEYHPIIPSPKPIHVATPIPEFTPPCTTPPKAVAAEVMILAVSYGDRAWTVADLAAEYNLDPRTIYARLALGCTVEEALAAPAQIPVDVADMRTGRAVELE